MIMSPVTHMVSDSTKAEYTMQEVTIADRTFLVIRIRAILFPDKEVMFDVTPYIGFKSSK